MFGNCHFWKNEHVILFENLQKFMFSFWGCCCADLVVKNVKRPCGAFRCQRFTGNRSRLRWGWPLPVRLHENKLTWSCREHVRCAWRLDLRGGVRVWWQRSARLVQPFTCLEFSLSSATGARVLCCPLFHARQSLTQQDITFRCMVMGARPGLPTSGAELMTWIKVETLSEL